MNQKRVYKEIHFGKSYLFKRNVLSIGFVWKWDSKIPIFNFHTYTLNDQPWSVKWNCSRTSITLSSWNHPTPIKILSIRNLTTKKTTLDPHKYAYSILAFHENTPVPYYYSIARNNVIPTQINKLTKSMCIRFLSTSITPHLCLAIHNNKGNPLAIVSSQVRLGDALVKPIHKLWILGRRLHLRSSNNP